MKITVLLENKSISEDLEYKHGLSFYIETNGYKILSDVGNDDVFINNAKKLDVDISKVEYAIISHGHGDHGGGLDEFIKNNSIGKIYIREEAFSDLASCHNDNYINIGLNDSLVNHNQVIKVPEYFEINENLILFSKVDYEDFLPSSNSNLYKKSGDEYIKDDFSHEQYLIIKEKDKNILVSGCAHKGVLNILKTAEKLVDGNIDICISGFHLYSSGSDSYEDEDFIKGLGEELKKTGTKFYTGHCTGDKAFSILKEILGDNLEYIKTGMSLEI